MPEFHGYVVSLRDATYYDGEHNPVAWSFYDGWDDGCSCSVSTNDFLGYNNTAAIRARANKDFNGLSGESSNFPATYYATDYFDAQVPAPAQSSGWFLPSAYQLKYIYDRVYFIPTAVTANRHVSRIRWLNSRTTAACPCTAAIRNTGQAPNSTTLRAARTELTTQASTKARSIPVS